METLLLLAFEIASVNDKQVDNHFKFVIIMQELLSNAEKLDTSNWCLELLAGSYIGVNHNERLIRHPLPYSPWC